MYRVTITANKVPRVSEPMKLCKIRWSGRLLKNNHIRGTSISGRTEPTTRPGNESLLLILARPKASG